jgi:hypothetical protein
MTTTTLSVNDQQQLQNQVLKKLDEPILHQKQQCSKQRNPSSSEKRDRERRPRSLFKRPQRHTTQSHDLSTLLPLSFHFHTIRIVQILTDHMTTRHVSVVILTNVWSIYQSPMHIWPPTLSRQLIEV